MAFPNRGPYDPINENLPPMPEGMIPHQFPWDVKYPNDPEWYDTLGRSLVEQRGVFTKGYSDDEQVEMIKQILAANPTDPNGEGRELSITLEAAMKGSAAVMRWLVHREKDLVGQLDVETMIASYNGFLDVVKVLVEEAGMSVNLERNGDTPLIKALLGGHPDLVKWLLEKGADWKVNEEGVFRSAVRSGKVELIELLLKKATDEDPDQPSKTWIKGPLLSEAAMTANEELMRFVIDHGDYPLANEASLEQRHIALNAMLFAVKNEETNQNCLQCALDRGLQKDESGAFVKTNDEETLTCFRIGIVGTSCNRGKLADMRRLISLLFECTNVKQDSDEFRTVLRYAMRRCYDPISKPCAIELLEKYNADPNSSADGDEYFGTPLTLGAVGRNDAQWAKFWLEHGANIHHAFGSYCNGPTALANAIRLGEYNTVMVLFEYGGPVDRMDDIEKMVGADKLQLTVVGTTDEAFYENGEVELRTVAKEEEIEEPPAKTPRTDIKTMILEFEDGGVTEEWLKKIQLRKPAAELAEDGTGRPRRGHRA